jgi:3D (Asp-Asp-Asp) domain-containing protein
VILLRKVLVPVVAIVVFVALYEVTILDSRYASREAALARGKPVVGSQLRFIATAYCKGLTTASGVAVQRGAVAADPAMLPVGSVLEVDALDSAHNGLYTVLDTGPELHGLEIDIYMWSCYDALRFGRRQVSVTVLRLGWNPQAAAPTQSFMERWLRRVRPTLVPISESGEVPSPFPAADPPQAGELEPGQPSTVDSPQPTLDSRQSESEKAVDR